MHGMGSSHIEKILLRIECAALEAKGEWFNHFAIKILAFCDYVVDISDDMTAIMENHVMQQCVA